ncbi:MAG: 2'-5' RNA ligase family protein, partial [Nitrospirota bacterium]
DKTIFSDTCDLPDWHHGRQDYSVWLIELNSMEVSQKVRAAREHLSEFLIQPYQRQPHITVFVCGFLADTARYADDYSVEQFERHAQSLRSAAVKPFTVEIGGLNSFASAPYLEVADPEGGIERLRTLFLTNGMDIARSTYSPHVTIGLYAAAFPGSVVSERIASFPRKPCKLTVDRVTFATYRAQETAGALTWRHEIAFP